MGPRKGAGASTCLLGKGGNGSDAVCQLVGIVRAARRPQGAGGSLTFQPKQDTRHLDNHKREDILRYPLENISLNGRQKQTWVACMLQKFGGSELVLCSLWDRVVYIIHEELSVPSSCGQRISPIPPIYPF